LIASLLLAAVASQANMEVKPETPAPKNNPFGPDQKRPDNKNEYRRRKLRLDTISRTG